MTRSRLRRRRGEGTVYLRADGRWTAQVYVTVADGRRLRRTLYGRSREDVEGQVLELRRKSHSRIPIAPTDLTVERYLREWLDRVVAHRVRPNTLAGYRYHAERYLLPGLGKRRVARLSARDVRVYLEELRHRGVGARTVQYVHATLRAALEDAVREELLERNVAKLVRVPTPPRVERQPLTVEEVRVLLRATREHRLHALFVVFALLGLRRSEALALRWCDVDLDQGVLEVRGGLQRVDGQLVVLPTKTARSRRTVPLPPVVVERLVEHREQQVSERDELGTGWPDLGFVFTSVVGTPLDPRNCTRLVQVACERAGVRRVRLHDFRHGCVSVLLDMGVPPRTAMEIVGHTTLEMTMNVYGHVSLESRREAMDRLGDLFEEDAS